MDLQRETVRVDGRELGPPNSRTATAGDEERRQRGWDRLQYVGRKVAVESLQGLPPMAVVVMDKAEGHAEAWLHVGRGAFVRSGVTTTAARLATRSVSSIWTPRPTP